MKKILITGVAGFVGSTLAEKLLNLEYKVVGIDNLKYGYKERIKDFGENFLFIEDDVKNLVNIDGLDDIDVIVNCSAIAPLPENQKKHYDSIRENVAICGSIIDFATLTGIINIIHFSSSAVYENGMSYSGQPAKITDKLKPRLMYPVSKYLSEVYLESQAEVYNLNVLNIRLFNLYGPKQDYFRKQLPLIGYLIKSLLNNNEITLYASESSKRDYIYIDDLINLLLIGISESRDTNFKTINAGSGCSYSVYDIIRTLEEVSGEKINYNIGDKNGFWDLYPELFNKKIPLDKKYLVNEVDKNSLSDLSSNNFNNWTANVDLKNGLNDCYKYAMELLK